MHLTDIRALCLPALFTLLALGGCGKNETSISPSSNATAPAPAASTAPATSNTAVVRIGHAAPLTGPQAHLGKDNENGIRLAIDELNAKHFRIGSQEVRFELVSEDDMADPRTATQVAQKLVDAGVQGIIGHLNSGTSIPASKIYHDAGLVQIQRAILSPMLYIIWLVVQHYLIAETPIGAGWATAIGGVIGIGASRIVHTIWMLVEERRHLKALADSSARV